MLFGNKKEWLFDNMLQYGIQPALNLPLTDFVAFIDTHCFVLHVAFGPLQFPTPVLKCVKHYCMVSGIGG
jgi:hypothetical protein